MQTNFKKWLPHLLAVASGAVWLLIVLFRMDQLPEDYYRDRDDGIITLSHAKNYIDFGFIGINEAGERVEGYSSPLQFLIFAGAYGITGTGYSAWIFFQVLACSFFIGIVVFYCLREFSENIWWCFPAAILAGWLMMRSFSAFGWHVSGMENSITHLMYALCALVFLKGLKQEKLSNWIPVLLFLASLSRFESIFHIGLWTGFFCFLHFIIFRNFQSLKWGIGLLAFWSLGLVLHYWYFGDFVPNTAHSQGISFSKNLANIFHNLKFMVNECAQKNFALLFIPAFAMAAFSLRNRKFLASWAILAFPMVFFVLHVLLFATVRLDPARTNTFVTEFAVMALFTAGIGMNKWKWAAFLPLIFSVLPLPAKYFPKKPYEICCSPLGIEKNRQHFLEISKAENIYRPFVANPDLGSMSFEREFHITDLGMLGSTFFAHYKDNRMNWNEYLFRISKPDLIEIHGVWSCFYPELFHDPRWKEYYEKLPQYIDSVFIDCKSDTFLDAGIFIRKDIRKNAETSERIFLNKMSKNPSLKILNEKIIEFNEGRDPSAQKYLAQMVWRFLPDFRKNGLEKELKKVVQTIKNPHLKDLCLIFIGSSWETGFEKKIYKWLQEVPK